MNGTIVAMDWPHIDDNLDEWREILMAKQPCSEVNKPNKPQPMPNPGKPESPGACSSPSLGKK